MSRSLLTVPAGFVAMFVTATAIAIAMRPLVAPMFGPYIRTDADGLAFLPLIAGYFVVTLVLAWLLPRVATGLQGWRHGAVVGLALGLAVFLGDHLVTAGWSQLPALPMLISGALDAIAVMAGGAAMALTQPRSVHP
jgi:hypothetical protein